MRSELYFTALKSLYHVAHLSIIVIPALHFFSFRVSSVNKWNIILLFRDLTKEMKRPQILFMAQEYRNV